MVSAIPDRWLLYKACGKIIEGTRIICFKVPLKRSLLEKRVDPKNIWSIKELLITVPKLGAVLDLTNTKRYYNPEKLKSCGIHYKKIFMPGRIIPPENKVKDVGGGGRTVERTGFDPRRPSPALVYLREGAHALALSEFERHLSPPRRVSPYV
ncbi:unnamed protein product, partial [Iphiclides podalirius]